MAKIAEVTQGQWAGLIGEVTKETKTLVYIRKPDGKGSAIVNRVDMIEVEVKTVTVDIEELTMSDGYVGHFGKTWKTPTTETFEQAVAGAMEMNNLTREQVLAKLAAGEALRWCKSANFYYDHSYGQIGTRRQPRQEQPEIICTRCGASSLDGAMFTTGGGNICDDCF